jgi:ketosteroid isomerase-like protein
MKKTISFVFIYLFAVTVFAQSADEKAVAAAVEKFRKAMIASDKGALESLAASDLSYGHSSGLIEDKAAFVDQFVTGKTDFLENLTFSDQTIRIAGDAAIVRHRLTGDTNNNKTPGKVDIIILMVWQKQKGDWKLLARQAAKIPPKA